MTIPLLEASKISGRDITADALLTQRIIAEYIVSHNAHYHFTVKENQPTLSQDIRLFFENPGTPDYIEPTDIRHGRIETRRIWCSTEMNNYLKFPHIGQIFLIERERIEKKSGKRSLEHAVGITSQKPEDCSPKRLLEINRGHWTIESLHYIIDWNYDEDRSRIRTGHGPANMTRLRRLAIGVLKSFQKPKQSITEIMQRLARNPRQVLDYLRMTDNSKRIKPASG